MLKIKIIKKISIVLLCVLIVEILRIFPNDNVNQTYVSVNKGVIYLLDNQDYLARLEITYDAKTDEEMIREIIDILTINKNSTKIRVGFHPIIPENTKLLNVSLRDDNVVLNFSKNFYFIFRVFWVKFYCKIFYVF